MASSTDTLINDLNTQINALLYVRDQITFLEISAILPNDVSVWDILPQATKDAIKGNLTTLVTKAQAGLSDIITEVGAM